MNARAKTAILPWLMAATVVLAVLTACATIWDPPLVFERPFEVRCGIENARPVLLPSHEVIVTTDEGWAILPLPRVSSERTDALVLHLPPLQASVT